VPGLGQFVAGRRARGLTILALVLLMVGLVAWAVTPQAPSLTVVPLKGDQRYWGWLAAVAVVWLWNIWDAVTAPPGRPVWLPALASIGMFLIIGWQATQIDLAQFTQHGDRLMLILRPMLQPDFIQPRTEKTEGWVTVEVPCSAAPPAGTNTLAGRTLTLSAGCATVGDTLTVTGGGFLPDIPAHLIWQSPIGDYFPLRTPENPGRPDRNVDASGAFTAQFTVPNAIPPGIDPTLSQNQRLYIRQERPLGGYELSTNGQFVLLGIYQTIALALMATTLGALLAIPISFLAAPQPDERQRADPGRVRCSAHAAEHRALNRVAHHRYCLCRDRGAGAVCRHAGAHRAQHCRAGQTLFEVIEGIDPGPIEAMQTTGANWLQVVRYGVIPQVVRPLRPSRSTAGTSTCAPPPSSASWAAAASASSWCSGSTWATIAPSAPPSSPSWWW
jgi:phosphonate transport system permease protein